MGLSMNAMPRSHSGLQIGLAAPRQSRSVSQRAKLVGERQGSK
jgi:hypothetical protein